MTQHTDTIVAQASRIAYFQDQEAYNYNRSLTYEFDLWKWMVHQFERMLSKLFSTKFVEDYSEPILVALFVVLVIAFIWFVVRKHPQLFMRAGEKTKMPYTVHEDHIYGVDFNAEIADALRRNDYKTVVRMLYLQTLKRLDDTEVIDWQPHKTPTQYLYEVKQEDMRMPFRRLTIGFLRVRYGNFDATPELAEEMKSLQQAVVKGGKS